MGSVGKEGVQVELRRGERGVLEDAQRGSIAGCRVIFFRCSWFILISISYVEQYQFRMPAVHVCMCIVHIVQRIM